MNLPPLTERLDRGASGGNEFKRLMHQLLLRYGDKERFSYEPMSSAGGDGGLDGLAPKGGVPGIDGPVAFQFKWLWSEIHKGSKAAQIKDSFKRATAELSERGIKHWVLVTPWDLTPAEKSWLGGLGAGTAIIIHAWGREKVESLLRLCPPLFARYYPHEAAREGQPALAGYDGFDFREFARCLPGQDPPRLRAAPHHRLAAEDPPGARRAPRDPAPRHLRPSELLDREEARWIDHARRGAPGTALRSDPRRPGDRKVHPARLSRPPLRGWSHVSGTMRLRTAWFRSSSRSVTSPGCSRRSRTSRSSSTWRSARAAITGCRRRTVLSSSQPCAWAKPSCSSMASTRWVARSRGIASRGPSGRSRPSTPAAPSGSPRASMGLHADVRLPESIHELRVGRLEDAQVDDFVGRWYAIQIPHNERERTELTESLRHAVHRTPSVRRLAGNPLLLTLMAFIHQGLRRLPTDRGELYDLCVDMLLRDWQDARRGHTGVAEPHPFEKLGLHVHTQKDYLAHLALFMQERNEAPKGGDARGLIARARCNRLPREAAPGEAA